MTRLAIIGLALACLAQIILAQSPAPKDRTVILISLDGFAGYALEDARLPVPNLRRLAREGAVARRMQTINPTVTWPNHTSMVTGVPAAQHSVLYNGLLVRGGAGEPVRVEPWRDKAELVKVPTVYDLAHQAGLTTAEVDWVAVQNAPTITWSFAEIPKTTGRIEQEMIAAGLVSEKDITEFQKASITWRDQIWSQAAIYILEKHRPNLLLFHLLNTDSVQHRYGPRSLAAGSALALADARVGELYRALESAKMLDRTTILIVADHGFKVAKKQIHPNALLRKEGLLRVVDGKVRCDAYAVPEGGTAMVYVTAAAGKPEIAARLKKMFAGLEGVDRVIEPSEYASLGLPSPEQNDRMADLVLAAKDSYAFTGSHQGDAVAAGGAEPTGSHGYLNSDPEMDAIFIAWGRGIRKGVKLDSVRNLDLAPTIAALLGLQMNNVAGQRLGAILIE
jgi:predicted AlkP superfamily pyrophosphatase or phosphodiesterase